MSVTVKCISPMLNHIVYSESGQPHRVQVGETFKIKSVPKQWAGLVAITDDGAEKKVAVTNPAKK